MGKLFLVFILLIAIGLIGCKKEAEISPPNLSGAKEFDIIAKRFAFEPDTITVSKGDVVKLKIRSVDVAHGISIPEFGVHERLPAGEEIEIVFTADIEGEFPFVCSVFCGNAHGTMKGKVIVR